MDYAGSIKAVPDPPGIDRNRWLSLIKTHALLMRPEPRPGISPFTPQPTVFHPPETVANLVIDGNHLGSFDWSQNDENVLIACGELATVHQ